MTGGILIAFWVNYALKEFENGWRYALAGQAVPALVLLLSCLWIPRSPRWLVQQGLIEEAELTLFMLRTHKTAQAVREELADIQNSIEEESQGDQSWRSLWEEGISRRRLLIGCAIQSGQNLTGINAIMYLLHPCSTISTYTAPGTTRHPSSHPAGLGQPICWLKGSTA